MKDTLFLELFGYEVMTIFTTCDCRFTTFKKLLIAKKQKAVEAVAVEALLEIDYNQSGCYNIELALSFLS